MAGTTIALNDDRLDISVEGWDKVWALKGGFDIPLAHVRAAEIAPAGIKPQGIRAPGTAVPGRYLAGTWRGRSGKEFWNVRDKANAIVIELTGEDYDRLILEVDDPAATVAAIQAALDQRAAAPAG